MTREDIIVQVKAKLEELYPFDDGLILYSETDTETLDYTKPIQKLIEETLDEAAKDTVFAAPLHLCPITELTGTVSVTNDVGFLNLPSDFLRLGPCKFGAWERPAKIIPYGGPDYDLQKNTYTRGGYAKPVVCVVNTSKNIHKLEIYTIKTADKGSFEIGYVKTVVAEELPDILVPALSWLCAGKVLQIMEKPPYKQAFDQFANQITELSSQ